MPARRGLLDRPGKRSWLWWYSARLTRSGRPPHGKVAGALAAALAGLLSACGSMQTADTVPSSFEVIRCRRVEVTDANGACRIALSVADGNAEISVLDGSGTSRLELGVYSVGQSSVALLDAEGHVRVNLMALGGTGSGVVFIFDRDGRRRVFVGDDDGCPLLAIFDGKGMMRAALGLSRDVAAQLGVPEGDREGSLAVFDSSGTPTLLGK